MARHSAYSKACAQLGSLSRSDLMQLRSVIDDLLELIEKLDSSDVADSGAISGTARGHIEHKMINGYGPYAYLRVWRDGCLTSTYLGKVDQA